MIVKKPPLLTVTPVHRSLLFCIAPCSVQLVDPVLLNMIWYMSLMITLYFFFFSFFSWYTVNTVARNHKNLVSSRYRQCLDSLPLSFFTQDYKIPTNARATISSSFVSITIQLKENLNSWTTHYLPDCLLYSSSNFMDLPAIKKWVQSGTKVRKSNCYFSNNH